jgi:hypothetical protein
MPAQQTVQQINYVPTPGIVGIPLEDGKEYYASDFKSDTTIILQEEDTCVSAGGCNPVVSAAAGEDAPKLADPGNRRSSTVAVSTATADAMVVGSYGRGFAASHKRRRTASFTEAEVDSIMAEAAAEAEEAVDAAAVHRAVDPADVDILAAAAAAGQDAVRTAEAGNRKKGRVLPGHSIILCISSSYCKAKLTSWSSTGKDGKAEVIITVPPGEQVRLKAD